jgi:hypothetical protein
VGCSASPPQDRLTNPRSTLGDKIYDTASYYIMFDYIWGSKNPNILMSCLDDINNQPNSYCEPGCSLGTYCNYGFDCSGLTQWVYENNNYDNIDTGTNVEQQWNLEKFPGVPSPRFHKYNYKDAVDGDLVFLGDPPVHVGLWFYHKAVEWNYPFNYFIDVNYDSYWIDFDVYRREVWDWDDNMNYVFMGYDYYYEGDVIINASGTKDHIEGDIFIGDVVVVPAGSWNPREQVVSARPTPVP